MADSKKYDGSQWEHSLRKQTTASEIIVPPTTIYADGTAISTYTIKGNTVQNGTPTPSNPVAVNGVGERTENLCDVSSNNVVNYSSSSAYQYTINADKTITIPEGKAMYSGFKVKVNPSTTYTVHCAATYNGMIRIREFSDKITDWSTNFIVQSVNVTIKQTGQGYGTVTFTTTAETEWLMVAFYIDPSYTPCTLSEIMLLQGSYDRYTIPDYIPYGFKIPISSGGTTTPVYLSEPLMKIGDSVDSISNTEEIRAIKKYVITGDEIGWSQDGSSGSNNRYRLYISDVKNTGTYITDFYNSHYKVETGYAANTSVIWRGTSSTYVYISVPSSDYPTVSDYKTYLQQQYTNGTPVTIWYQMANPTTTQITAPSIPTTDGANTISVDTTVQPSEVSMTWTGWHDASVKEKSENLLNPSTIQNGYTIASDTGLPISSEQRIATTTAMKIPQGTTSIVVTYNSNNVGFMYSAFRNGTLIERVTTKATGSVLSLDNIDEIYFSWYKSDSTITTDDVTNIMVNTGSTALPYVPYWE